ncbi:MAG TPA: Fic family protein, partial [Patescibacteria group bacterium]
VTALATALRSLPITDDHKQHLHHLQTLKSSLFSARIEGNTLSLIKAKDIDLSHPKDVSQLEVSNLLKAEAHLKKLVIPLTEKQLLELHTIVLKGLSPNAGSFRHESSAIFDGVGNIVYLTPSPSEMKNMVTVLLEQINAPIAPSDRYLLTIAACHYYFEKTHPFLDGNGRVGRILIQYQLRQSQLFNSFILPIDEYFNLNKAEYYYYLEKNTRQIEGWISFFLEGLSWAMTKILEDAKALVTEKYQLRLLPRRQEILEIIKDHPQSSLDFICRRFPTIPKRTIQYDVQQLIKENVVIKLGKTRGVVYQAAS